MIYTSHRRRLFNWSVNAHLTSHDGEVVYKTNKTHERDMVLTTAITTTTTTSTTTKTTTTTSTTSATTTTTTTTKTATSTSTTWTTTTTATTITSTTSTFTPAYQQQQLLHVQYIGRAKFNEILNNSEPETEVKRVCVHMLIVSPKSVIQKSIYHFGIYLQVFWMSLCT